ncbi:hypothetical protein [Lysinibacillus sphaericus]|uniref:Uncharacterized protein n=1 Tax=Lysinibacillus sphaericus OT4b.31 TaxID=1285586 RepID=R7Z8U3_LYSSH|nr:hypothetical protein [Lysinibacillus sphaericus]EON70381.1 hypothetical protein H131_21757 [Lysinibacillus sphaericus OT4b.31]
MKKKLLFLLMVMFLAFQPLSVNLDRAFAKEKGENNDCNSCSQKLPLPMEKAGLLKNNIVIHDVKEDLDIAEKFSHSEYNKDDFDWENTEFLDFGKDKDGLMIPYKQNNENFDIRLLTAYDKTNGEVSNDFIIMKSILDIENNEIEITYSTLNDEKIVGMTLEVGTNEIIERKIYNEVSPTDSGTAGYWSDTWDCLKNAWKNAPELTKQLCSAACLSVIFGGNIVGAVTCASCLGAQAMVCLIH